MEDNTLFDVYLDELKDMWSANEQMREVVSEMADAAGDRQLSELLKRLGTRLEARNRSIRDLLLSHGEEAEDPAEQSKAMQGLAAQARDEALEKPLTDASRDVVIVARVQRMSHYCIAGYGTARAIAEALKLTKDAEVLSADLDTVYASDELLTHLAENVINPASADEDDEEEDEEETDFTDDLGEEKNGYDDEDVDDEEEEEDEDEGRMK